MKNKSFVLDLNPALIAILVPVSTRSPVNIQTWRPAPFNASIVVCTFCCSLSSTPDTPKKSKSYSRRLTAF